MWNEIAAWQEQLHLRPDLSAKTIALYTQDVRRFATWLQYEHPVVLQKILSSSETSIF
jgi:site-specific recombinase XerD